MHLQVSFPATRTSIDTQLSMKTTLYTHSGHTYSHILTIYSHTAHTNSYIYTHSFIIYAYTHIYSHTLTHIFSNIHTVYTLKCTHTGNKYLYSHAHLHTHMNGNEKLSRSSLSETSPHQPSTRQTCLSSSLHVGLTKVLLASGEATLWRRNCYWGGAASGAVSFIMSLYCRLKKPSCGSRDRDTMQFCWKESIFSPSTYHLFEQDREIHG